MNCKLDSTICIKWKNNQGESFKVGELSKKTGKYYFKYDVIEVQKAKEYGFSLFPCFPKVDAKYFREELFRTFSIRLPGHGKKDKTLILKEYDLKKYDDFELLKIIGDKILNDNIEFSSCCDEEKTIEDEEKSFVDEEKSLEDEQ